METETEIVSDAPIERVRRKAAKNATEACADKSAVTSLGAVLESALSAVVVASAGEERVQRLSDQAQSEQIQRQPDEEIRELEVVRIPANPRLVMATYEVDGRKEVVKVLVGVNRNFKPRMVLRAQPGATLHAPWRLIGKRPRLPGRW